MNERFYITGFAGKKKLEGVIPVSGAKNAVLKAMAATILFKGKVELTNVPEIEDALRMLDLLKELGAEVDGENGKYTIDTGGVSSGNLATDISKKLRASIVLSGPLLSRFGKVSFPHPGGCVIGARPIDLFLDGFEKMGALVSVENDGERARYVIKAPKGGLRGAEIFFRSQSVTGTETFMMAGVLAKGDTIIKNAALEPEIYDLAQFLNSAGAKIEGAGTPTIKIKGMGLLSARKKYVTPPDRIEAGSFLILVALCGKDVTVSNCEPAHLESLIEILCYSGIDLIVGKNFIRVKNDVKKGGKNKIRAVNLKTHEYPGFPTDLQAPMSVYLTQAVGESQVFETIFEGRLNYLESLVRMGANITIMDPHRAIVRGPTPLVGKELESPDLRAGLAFVIAAIVAKGDSVIHNVYNIDRGYEKIEERLSEIGVSITRITG